MREIPIPLLLRAVTPKRLYNAGLAISSFLYSAITGRNTMWGKPYILSIEPTNTCNLRCPLCITGNNTMTRSAGLMGFDTFRKIIDDLGEHLIYLLLYQQGEPFINRAFLDFVRYAKRRNIFVTTSTNGHYLDAERAAETVSSGLDSMIVSIDGADQATYAKYRVHGQLSKVLQGVANVVTEKNRQKKNTPVVYLQFIVMRHNEHQIADMKRLQKKLGANHLLLKTVYVNTASQAQVWLPVTGKYRRYRWSQNNLSLKNRSGGTCHRPWTSGLINWDGSTVPCCFDKNATHTFGNTDDRQSFSEIWLSDGYKEFRQQMLDCRDNIDICTNCSQGIRLFR